MAVIDIGRFVATKDQVALKVAFDRLPGLLRKRLDVPKEAVALLRRADKSRRLVAGGESEGDFQDGVLVKKAPLSLEVSSTGLVSEEGLDVSASLRLDVVLRATEVDLAQLERELLASRDLVSREDIERYFAPFVREALRFYCQKRSAESLTLADQRVALEAHLKDELKKPCFDAGIDLVSILHPTFKSAAYD